MRYALTVVAIGRMRYALTSVGAYAIRPYACMGVSHTPLTPLHAPDAVAVCALDGLVIQNGKAKA